MTKPQRKLNDFAQYKSAENDSEDLNHPAGAANAEESEDKTDEVDKSSNCHYDIDAKSELNFGKKPDEFDIDCLWARRYLAYRSADSLTKKRLTEASLDSYECELREYVNFLHHHNHCILNAEFQLFKDYILFCISAGRRTGTVMSRVSTVRGLYQHIELNEEVDVTISSIEFDEINREAFDDRTPSTIQREDLNRDELEKLFDSMNRNRDRLMAITGAETGFRNSDIREILIEDVDFDKPAIHARDPKNSRPYTVPISEELALELEIWIEQERKANYSHHDSEFLFPSQRDVQIKSNNGLIYIIRNAAEKAGLQKKLGMTDIKSEFLKHKKIDRNWKRVTPHTLRHSFITILEKEGVSLEYRRLLANHSSAETTRQYSHGKKNLLKKAQRRVDLRY